MAYLDAEVSFEMFRCGAVLVGMYYSCRACCQTHLFVVPIPGALSVTFVGNLVKWETIVLADASLVLIPTALSLKFSHPTFNVRMTNMSRKACCYVLVHCGVSLLIVV